MESNFHSNFGRGGALSNNNVTAIIPCREEEAQLTACILSARLLAGHVLVVNDNSCDGTVSLAERLGCEVVHAPPLLTLEQGQGRIEALLWLALPRVQTDFAMRLDADERLTPELAGFCQDRLASCEISGVVASRRNFFIGRYLDDGGWSTVQQVFLFRVSAVSKDWGQEIHQQIPIDGTLARARPDQDGVLLHLNYQSEESFVERSLIRYAQEDLVKMSRPSSVIGSQMLGLKIWWRLSTKLWGRLIIRAGARDLSTGVMAASLLSVYEVMRRLYSLEKSPK